MSNSPPNPAQPAYEHIRYSRNKRTATLTLHRPQALNGLVVPMMEEMMDALDRAETDPGVGVLVLTGAGRAFCSGADMGTLGADVAAVTQAEGEAKAAALQATGDRLGDMLEQHNHPLISRLFHFPKPVVAAVNGVVAGGGVGLALAADIVIAARSARFVLAFAPKLGIGADMGVSWLLPHLVGRTRAMGLTLLDAPFSAEQAERWGLIWQSVEDNALADTVRQVTEQLGACPAQAHKVIKQAINAADGHDLNQQLAMETAIQRERCGSLDLVEGVSAFLQKRKPDFHRN